MSQQSEVEIDESNFNDYFFDVRKFKPQKGQILARFSAMADLVDDWVKRNMVALLLGSKKGAMSLQKLMRNMIGATEEESIKVPLEMARDLYNGMTREEVLAKPYRFKLERYWWTSKECVPPEDPHWAVIEILNPDDLDKQPTPE